MHEDPQRNKAMMTSFMDNYPHRSVRIDPETNDYAYDMQNMMVGVGDNKSLSDVKYQTYKWEIDPETIADYQRHLDHSGHNIDPVEVEQDIYDQVLEEAELKRLSEIVAAGDAFWNALKQGAIDFLSGNDGMLSSSIKQLASEISNDSGRRKPVEIKNLRGQKPGWKIAEGSNFWSVDETDPYWQTQEGYNEGVDLYGMKPSFIKAKDVATLVYNPTTGQYDSTKKEEFVNLQPTKRMSL